MTLPTPTQEDVDRIGLAIIWKATRLYVMPSAPMGAWGDPSEFGTAVIRPDYQIREYLFGFQGVYDIVDIAGLVTPDDVIRNGLQLDPATFPTNRLPDIDRAIAAAESWVIHAISKAFGVA